MAIQDLGAPPSLDDHLIDVRTTRGLMVPCGVNLYTRTPGTLPANQLLTLGTMVGTLVVAGRDATVDQIVSNIVTAGAATSFIRLGIYTITFDGNGAINASLLVDGGQIASNTTGVKTASVSAALKYGTAYMITAVAQGSSTMPTISFVQNTSMAQSYATNTAALSTTANQGWAVTGTTGALPSTPTFAAQATANPLLAFRCSA